VYIYEGFLFSTFLHENVQIVSEIKTRPPPSKHQINWLIILQFNVIERVYFITFISLATVIDTLVDSDFALEEAVKYS